MSPTRRPFRAVALASALGLLALTPATVSQAAPGASRTRPEPAFSTVQVATYNVATSVKVSRTASDVRTIARNGADVIGLQEMASAKRRTAVREALGSAYAGHVPGPAVPGGTPIYYRADKFTLLDKGTEKVTEDTWVGPRGAGPSTIRAKWINWVRLQETTTNRQLYVINNHFVPTVQGGSGGPNSQHRRVAIYRKHMEALVAMIQRFRSETGGLVFVTGDFNVNYRNDSVKQASVFPYHSLGGIGVTSSFQNVSVPAEGTHVLKNGFSKRLIDYVFSLDRRGVAATGHRILFGLHSDHRAMTADFSLFGRGCFQRRQNVC